ncbi:MAG: DUF2892 domain-containing protein [Bacteroidota bacterium]
MNKFFKGISYGFNRNLGVNDRIIRAALGIGILLIWSLGFISGAFGVTLVILGVMILATAIFARCGVTYWMNICTIPKQEKERLDAKGIKYE